jgi:hypothetical protein
VSTILGVAELPQWEPPLATHIMTSVPPGQPEAVGKL